MQFFRLQGGRGHPAPGGHRHSACSDGRHTALLRLRSAAVLPSVRSRSGIAEAGRTHGLRMGRAPLHSLYSCRSFLTRHGLDRNCGSVRGTAVTPTTSPVMKGTENVRQRKRNKRSRRYGSERRSRSSNRYCLISFGERGSLAKAPSRTIHIIFLLSPGDCLCIS